MRKDGKSTYDAMKEKLASKQELLEKTYLFFKRLEKKQPGLFVIMNNEDKSDYLDIMIEYAKNL